MSGNRTFNGSTGRPKYWKSFSTGQLFTEIERYLLKKYSWMSPEVVVAALVIVVVIIVLLAIVVVGVVGVVVKIVVDVLVVSLLSS